VRAIDQTYTSSFHLFMRGPMPLRVDGIRGDAEDRRIAEVHARIAARDMAVFDDRSLFRSHPRLGDRVAPPPGWPSELAMVLRVREAGDLIAAELFALSDAPLAWVNSRRWVVWRCSDGAVVHACARDVVDVSWFDGRLFELTGTETGYALRRRHPPDFSTQHDEVFAFAVDDNLDPNMLVALATDRVIAVACDDHGQAACYDIIDLGADPPHRLHTTQPLCEHPAGSADGRWLGYADAYTVEPDADGSAWPIALVDLRAEPARVSHHRVAVPPGTKMLWGGLTLRWLGDRLAIRCADGDDRRFAWRGTFELPLDDRIALTRGDAESI